MNPIVSSEERPAFDRIRQAATSRCDFCGASQHSVISLGMQPIAQDFRFVNASADDGIRYHLQPLICLECGLVQLAEYPHSQKLFRAEYPFRSGVSFFMRRHLQALAKECVSLTAGRSNPFLLEIGCNDGTLSVEFALRALRHLGVDPALDALEEARTKGVSVMGAYFGPETAREIRAHHGPADIVVATNVIAHIPDIRATFEAVKTCLAEDGVFVFEAISLLELLRGLSFDQFYDEHFYTLSVTVVDRIARSIGLELFNCGHNAVQGGSTRYYIARRGMRPTSPAVAEAIARELEANLHFPETWSRFAADVADRKQKLIRLLGDLKGAGHNIAGYGAAAKSSVVMSYCRIDRRTLDCIFDVTPSKIGLISPCDHIPIVDANELSDSGIKYLLLFAWNFFEEINRKEAVFRKGGGHWIDYHHCARII
jgi:methylation protein EvaC